MHREHFFLLLCLLCSAAAALLTVSETPPETRCNFVCDSWDCADERHCGYHKTSLVLGSPFSCDFEQDDCGWVDTSTSMYRWVRDKRGFSMRGSRAHSDHTLGNKWGWFMAAEGHRGKSPVTATLRSPVLRDAASTCEIHVHYHMYVAGSSTMNGSLSLELADNTQTYSLWVSPQSSVSAWRQAVIYTGRITGAFQLIVSSSRDALSRGDVAIDDVEFRHCALPAVQAVCHAGQYQCSRGSCVAQDMLCDRNDDCGDNSDESRCERFGFCDFGTDFCGWTSTWERVNGSKSIRDHTSSSGSGIYLRIGSTNKATMTSGKLQGASNETCTLVLYYIMDGSDTNSLVIQYHTTKPNEITRIEGQRGPAWLRERVIFPVANEPFQITIEGEVGAGTSPVVALDDLVLSPGCNVVPGRFIAGSEPEIRTLLPGPDPFDVGVRETCLDTLESVDFGSAEKGWKDRSVGRLRWGRENRTLQEGDSRGHLAVQNAGGQLLTSAELRSPTYCTSTPSCAINMTYYFNSGPAGSLSVRVLDPELGTHTHAWHSPGDPSTSWRSVLIPLSERSRPFQVIVAGSVDPLPGGPWAAAVGSIQYVGCEAADPSSDTVPVTCNFETGLCGWFQDRTEELEWELRTLTDHTTGQGNLLSVSGTSRMDRGTRARLVTYPQSSATEQQCLSLYYRVWGPDAGSLNLFIKPAGEAEQLLWTVTATQGNRWHREAITLPTPTKKKYQLILEAVRDGSVGHIAVDDITLASGSCDPPTRCSFEFGSCGFTSQGTYTWKWYQNQHFGQTAPVHDHTLQSFSGHYMLADTGAAALPWRKSAVLTSASYNAWPDSGCLSFWYQFGGSDAGTLNVDLEENKGNKKVKRRLLSVSDTHRNVWHHKSATLQSGATFVLLFEAVGAGGDHSYIALDDIHMSHHQCHEAASCDFESGSCSWTNVRIPLVDTFDWDWTSGEALPGPKPGPERDRTLGTSQGHFAFVDTGALHTEGSSAWLISEHLPATSGSCFSFSHRTDSADHYHLAELVLYVSSVQGLLPVWVLQGYQSSDWQDWQLQLNSTLEYQIVFEAAKGSRPHAAVIALDDLKYTPDTPCNAVRQEKGKDNTGTIVAIFLGVLILLLCAAAAVFLYRKRRRNLEGAPRISSRIDGLDGFDNIVFEEATDRTSTSSDTATA